MPDKIVAENGCAEESVYALAMLCRRLVYPARLCDLQHSYGWEKSKASRIINTTAIWIFERWKHLLRWNPSYLTPSKLKEFADAVYGSGAPLSTCFGFIDGTLREVARPEINQRLLYNGWKRYHALKYHIVTSPDGMIAHIYGPVEGRRHDHTIYNMSGLSTILNKYAWDPLGNPLVIYGDSAYGLSTHLISPYPSVAITNDQALFNQQMAKVRESVEWGFAAMVNTWAFLDWKKNQKVLLSPVGIYFLVGAILLNAHTILYGSQTSMKFQCPPPRLDEYFVGEPGEEDDDYWCSPFDAPYEEWDERNMDVDDS